MDLRRVTRWVKDNFAVRSITDTEVKVNFLVFSGDYTYNEPAVPPIQRKYDGTVIANYFGYNIFHKTLIQRETVVPFLAVVCGGGGTAVMARFLLAHFPAITPATIV